MWLIGFLLILGTVSRLPKGNGAALLPEERGEDACHDHLSKMLLGALPDRHFFTDIKPKLILEIGLPNFATLFTGSSNNDILSQGNKVEFSVPDLDPEDPIHQINFSDWDRGNIENGIIIPEYGNFKNVKIPSHGRNINQIIYHAPGVSSFKSPYSNPSRKIDNKKDDDKLDHIVQLIPDIFEGLEDQETGERRKDEETNELGDTKKLEETKKPEGAKKAEASEQITESGSPQNRINYLNNHYKNADKNSKIIHNLRKHKRIRTQ